MKKTILSAIMVTVMAFASYVVFEGAVTQAKMLASTATGTTSAGPVDFDVILDVTAEIAITCPDGPLAMSPDIAGLTGGSAAVTGDCTVVTNNSAGYTLAITATGVTHDFIADDDPTHWFDNYTPTNQYDWISGVSSSTSVFGFSVQGTDTAYTFLNNGSACGSGSADYDQCWRGTQGAFSITIATSSVPTPSYVGTVTSLQFKAEVGGLVLQPEGRYRATIQATATTN